MWLAIVLSLLMWGIAYQGFNGVFPSLFPELFHTRVRVSGMAIGQNVGTTLSALLPALFVAVAPPGSANIPLKIGALTFGICVIAAIAAFTARETYRIHLNDLGDRNAVPVTEKRLRSPARRDDGRGNQSGVTAASRNQLHSTISPHQARG